ncbi:MAG: CRISPR-associated endoribonuclease Cas6 [Lachnospiraceae bacterium]|nr:CRISPR-associated endoribonuclease Cas6 [Lachnospiraceae bacterium]
MDEKLSDSVAHLELKLEADGDYFNYHKSSILQGVIMQEIRSEYAEMLHEQGLKPYSQYLEQDGKVITWHIKTLTETATREIIEPLLKDSFSEFYMEHDDQKVIVKNKCLKKERISDFLEEFYEALAERYLNLEFVTPTAFKKNGKYCFFPEIYNIYYSCMKKFDIASVDYVMFNEDTLEQLVEASEITSYSLHSVRFSMEGVKIPAFMGRITISVRGNQTLQNFARLLLRFGEYSGIGIKTAMGMGAVRLGKRSREDQASDRKRV